MSTPQPSALENWKLVLAIGTLLLTGVNILWTITLAMRKDRIEGLQERIKNRDKDLDRMRSDLDDALKSKTSLEQNLRDQVALTTDLTHSKHSLTRELASTKRDLARAKERGSESEEQLNELANLFESFRNEKDVRPEEVLKFETIMERLNELRALEHIEETPYKYAARWLKNNGAAILQKSLDTAIFKNSEILRGKAKEFRQDLKGYFDWIFVSLYQYQHPDSDIKHFVSVPAITSQSPYVDALRFSIEEVRDSELPTIESKLLTAMFQAAIEKIKYEFLNN